VKSPAWRSAGRWTVSGNVVTVDLSGVGNAQTITVNLLGVSDGSNTGNVSIPVSFLLGDATVTTAQNFCNDVSANGVINSTEIGIIKANSEMSLPPPAAPKAATQQR
jgi:hypothetical protein